MQRFMLLIHLAKAAIPRYDGKLALGYPQTSPAESFGSVVALRGGALTRNSLPT